MTEEKEQVAPMTNEWKARQRLEEQLGWKTLQRLIDEAGIYELNVLIKAILDRHYPADIFGDEDSILRIEWAGDLDPGVRWVALLRAALRQVPE